MDAKQTTVTDQVMNNRAALSSMKTLTQRASENTVGGAAGDNDISSDISADISSHSIVYRQTADRWIEEIQRLIKQNEDSQAQTEYRLFEKQHPDRARDFKPDFQSVEK